MVERRGLWRSRWAAIGAAVAVTLGGGGLIAVNAASSPPSSVVTIDPVRILDTRNDVGLPGPFVSAVSQKLQVTGAAVPVGATGVLLNVTVVEPTAAGFLSVRPGDATGAPETSSLNFDAGDIVPNSVQVALPTAGANAGQIDITYDAFGAAGPTTEVLVDAVGYMVVTPALAPDEIDAYTRDEADERFVQTTDQIDAYTRDEADERFVQTTDQIGVSGYQQVTNSGNFDTNNVKSVVATCPVGTVVTGGGGFTFPSLADPNRDSAPLDIRFSQASSDRSWQVQAIVTDPPYAFAWRLHGQAICVKVADD